MARKIISKQRYRQVAQLAKFYHNETATLALIEDYEQLIYALNIEQAQPRNQIKAIDKFFKRHPQAPVKKLSAAVEVECFRNNRHKTHPLVELLSCAYEQRPLSPARRRVAARLLSYGVSPDLSATDYIEPLSVAVINDDKKTAQLLLTAGANPNCVTERNVPVLFEAVIQLNFPMVNLLLDRQADINLKLNWQRDFRYLKNYNVLGYLHRATTYNYGPDSGRIIEGDAPRAKIIKMIKLLHRRGIRINDRLGKAQEPLSKIVQQARKGYDFLGVNWAKILQDLERKTEIPARNYKAGR